MITTLATYGNPLLAPDSSCCLGEESRRSHFPRRANLDLAAYAF